MAENIFSQYLKPPKSIEDYGAQLDATQANQLQIADLRRKGVQADQAIQEQNAFKAALAGGLDPNTAEGLQRGLGIAPAATLDTRKKLAEAEKLSQETKTSKSHGGLYDAQAVKAKYENEIAKRQQFAETISGFANNPATKPEDIVKLINSRIESGEVDRQHGLMTAAQMDTSSPEAFRKWLGTVSLTAQQKVDEARKAAELHFSIVNDRVIGVDKRTGEKKSETIVPPTALDQARTNEITPMTAPPGQQPPALQSSPAFEAALKSEGVTGQLADIARSIYAQESASGANTKTSNAGAVGGMQIIPSTFKGVADQGWDINNPEHNIRAGIRYLKKLEPLANGRPELIAAGYYGGEGAIPLAAQGKALRDPINPNAPDTIQYGTQVVSRLQPTGDNNVQVTLPPGVPNTPKNIKEFALAQQRSRIGNPRPIQVTDAAGNVTLFDMTGNEIKKLGAVGKPSATYEKTQNAKAKLSREIDAAISELEKATADGGLIDKSTGSGAGALVDLAAGFVGKATPGAIAVGQMKPIYDLVLKMVPRFEGPQSNKDTKSYEAASGDLANPAIPNVQKKAAAKEILRLMKARKGQFVDKSVEGTEADKRLSEPPPPPGFK
jgi:hypothetical protein